MQWNLFFIKLNEKLTCKEVRLKNIQASNRI